MKKHFQGFKTTDELGIIVRIHMIVTEFVITKRWIVAEWVESKYQTSTVQPISHLEYIRLQYCQTPDNFVELSKADYLEMVKQHPSQQDKHP